MKEKRKLREYETDDGSPHFYAQAMGWENIHVYDGGWYEWHKQPESPVKEKGLPEDAPEQKPEEFFAAKKK